MNLAGRHVLVLGLGESGLAMAQWCARNGAAVRVADTRETPPYLAELRRRIAGADFAAGEFAPALLDGIDLVALSPGLPSDLPLLAAARSRGIAVTGEIELFAQGLQALGERDRSKVIAITGTNGKTTTTALTGHLCRAGGLDAAVAGNISPAALTALMERQDAGKLPGIWVLELSSFQLETLEALDADAATVLNISDDHLDRYADVEHYSAAKKRIFLAGEGNEGVQVLNRQDARVSGMAMPGRRVVTFGLDVPPAEADFGLRERAGQAWIAQGDNCLLPVSDLPLSGLHNAANAMAALALCAGIGLDVVTLLPALRSFRGLPHRVERVAEIAGVSWFDDSKGTNVGATVAALEGIGGQMAALNSRPPPPGREGSQLAAAGQDDRKIVLIAGGDGKGQDFSPLRPAVERHARAAVLIGRDGPKIASAIAGCGVPVLNAADMGAAVRAAADAAQPGDAVLLSPACASFDMFRNYEHRAQVFCDAVIRLQEAVA